MQLTCLPAVCILIIFIYEIKVTEKLHHFALQSATKSVFVDKFLNFISVQFYLHRASQQQQSLRCCNLQQSAWTECKQLLWICMDVDGNRFVIFTNSSQWIAELSHWQLYLNRKPIDSLSFYHHLDPPKLFWTRELTVNGCRMVPVIEVTKGQEVAQDCSGRPVVSNHCFP